jgi:hypothetical protein
MNSFGQKSSLGINVSLFEKHGSSTFFKSGVQSTVNFGTQFSETLGWKVELGYGDYKNVKIINSSSFGSIISTSNRTLNDPDNPLIIGMSEDIDLSKHFFLLRSSITIKIFDTKWLNGEILIGPGLYQEEDSINGLIYGELFLSKSVSDKIALGLPISVNYIFGNKQSFSALGLSMRYYL